MRIAQVSPLYENVPPEQYGGTERVVSYVTEELVRLGHQVTLFATAESTTAAQLVPCCPKALWGDPGCRDPLPHHVREVELVLREAHRFDIVHFHLDYVHFPALRRFPCPTLTTLHGMLYPPDERAFLEAFPEAPLVSISQDQRAPIPDANWKATVHHGLPRDLLAFHDKPGTYLAFLGRIAREKGLEAAVEIAGRAGMPLKVAARIYPGEQPYFHQEIEPLLRRSPWVEFVGEVGGRQKNEFLGNASALLFPINWSEPFGLVMIESLACGTPVIAFRRGSVPEVIEDGVAGFVVDDVNEAVAAVQRIGELSRRRCRQEFVDRFNSSRMTHDYLDVYAALIADWRDRRAGVYGERLAHRVIHPSKGLLGPVDKTAAMRRAPVNRR